MADDELWGEVENWSAAEKERAWAEVQRRASTDKRIFYCAGRRPKWDASGKLIPGSGCDGAPHDGYPYRHAREDQWPPPGTDWLLWFLMGGRGSGKTRTGAEYVRQMSKKVGRIALIGATNQAVRDVMVEGESGLMNVFGNYGEKIEYRPALRRITFPSGAIATLFTGEEPDRLRGPQHGGFWLDEPSHFPLIDDVWDQLMFGMRLGQRPHGLCTSTPLPNKWTKARVADPKTRMVRVSTYANLANLAPTVKDTILARFEGTRMGKQELEGELLADVEGALWRAELMVTLQTPLDIRDFERIIVSIDPAGTANRRSDETGIVVVGKRGNAGYVLGDYSGKYSPQGWSEKADWAYRAFKADAIVAEKNFGGDMVKTTIESSGTSARIIVTTASRSKQLRAEPVVALYEQRRIFHNVPVLELEEEMLTWVPGQGDSPNRIDAMVHGFTELFGGFADASIASASGRGPLSPKPSGVISPFKRRIRPRLPRST